MILFEDAKATAPPDPPSPFISPVERVKEFKLLFPNYEGELMVDGGVTDMLLGYDEDGDPIWKHNELLEYRNGEWVALDPDEGGGTVVERW